MVYQTLIIGGGPAGLSAALYAGRGGLLALLLSGSLPGGQALQTLAVDNYPGSPQSFTGPGLITNLTAQVESFGVPMISESALAVKKLPDSDFFEVTTEKNTYQTQTIIIATGATRSHLGLTGEAELIGRGLSFCATCDGPFFREKAVAVVGGGSAALEEALFLTNFASQVHLIHRRASFRAPDIHLIEQVKNHSKITLHFQTQVTNYLSDEKGRLSGLVLTSSASPEPAPSASAPESPSKSPSAPQPTTFNLPIAGVFLAIGTRPNSEIFRRDFPDLRLDPHGYILTDPAQAHLSPTMTHQSGVFVAGDVADPLYKQFIVATATGAQAALDARHYLMVE